MRYNNHTLIDWDKKAKSILQQASRRDIYCFLTIFFGVILEIQKSLFPAHTSLIT